MAGSNTGDGASVTQPGNLAGGTGSAALKGGAGDAAPTSTPVEYRSSADSGTNWPTLTLYSEVK